MWFKSAASNSVGGSGGRRSAPSILSEGFRVDGDIACSGEVHIGGTLIGNLVAGKVTLGEAGSINLETHYRATCKCTATRVKRKPRYITFRAPGNISAARVG